MSGRDSAPHDERVAQQQEARHAPASAAGTVAADARHVAGVVTVGAMLLAVIVDNSPVNTWYDLIHHLPVSVHVGELRIDKPLVLWINDGLMVFFFLLITLELKREALEGRLSTRASFVTPAFAALGGMVVPASIYAMFNMGDPAAMRGWAIPVATDTVLALTALTLLGGRVQTSLKLFLTALATFDDLGAILVIAVFYTGQLAVPSLVAAAICVAALAVLNAFGITRMAAYVVVGVLLWFAVLGSGVHGTLAGVVVGLAIPMKATRRGRRVSPLREIENQLYTWVAFGVVPTFAFFNSGIVLSWSSVSGIMLAPSLGIVLGLALGKCLGIVGATWLAIRFRVARLPQGAGWQQLFGVALIAGVGFTMSLFIAGLAFTDPEMFRHARLSVVVGSLLSAGAGIAVLSAAHGRNQQGVTVREPFQ